MNSIRRHATASVYVFSAEKVLLIFHPKMQKWLPPGGHLEKGELPHEGAKREVLEETGLQITLRLQENIVINQANAKSTPRPYLCLLEVVEDKQEPHEHIDFIYVADAVDSQALKKTQGLKNQTFLGSAEKIPLRWFSLEEALALQGDKEIFIETQEILQHLMQAPKLAASPII